MRTAICGAVFLAAGGIALLTGVLPAADALVIWERVWPILLFVLAITVVTELAAGAGVFTQLAQLVSRWGRGRAWLLWLLVVAVAALSTIFLSLDTTAVLLTPVVIGMARHARIDPLPFALTTVWMANAGSLLLPVSNLTNLLAQHAMGNPSPAQFASLMMAPAIVAAIVPMTAVLLISRRSLFVRYDPGESDPIDDPVLFWIAVGILAALIPLLVSGLPVWIPASGAALVLAVVFRIRRPRTLRFGLIPWQLLLFAGGLFLFVGALQAVGLGTVLATIAGSGQTPGALLQLSIAGMVGANVIDNLPAYLALEQAAGTPLRLAALLIGVNAGPLITPWASLATLLWHQRLTAFDVGISWKRYILLGLVIAPVTVVLATLALAFV